MLRPQGLRAESGYWSLTMIFLALTILLITWIAVAATVAGVCASAAAGDRALRARYTLPRPSTWRTVRSKSLRSSQSDQLATYR